MSSKNVFNAERLGLDLALAFIGAAVAAWRSSGAADSVERISAVVKGRELLLDAPGWWLNIVHGFFYQILGVPGAMILAAIIGAGCGAGLAWLLGLTQKRKTPHAVAHWMPLWFGALILISVPGDQWLRGVGPVLMIFSWATALTVSAFRCPGKTALTMVLVALFSCALSNTWTLGPTVAVLYLALVGAIALGIGNWRFSNLAGPNLVRISLLVLSCLIGLLVNPNGVAGVWRSLGMIGLGTPWHEISSRLLSMIALFFVGLAILAVWLRRSRATRDYCIFLTVVLILTGLLTSFAPALLAVCLAMVLVVLTQPRTDLADDSSCVLPKWIQISAAPALILPAVLMLRLDASARSEAAPAAAYLPTAESVELMRKGRGRLFCSAGTEPFVKFQLFNRGPEVEGLPQSVLFSTLDEWKSFVRKSKATMFYVNPASEQGRLAALALEDEEWFVANCGHAGVLFGNKGSGLQPMLQWSPDEQDAHPVETALNAWYAGWRAEAVELLARRTENGGAHGLGAKRALAQIAVETKNWSDAVEMSRRVLRDRPGDVRALYIHVLGLLESGELRAAYQWLDRLLKAAPNDLPCLILAARTARAAKDHQYEVSHLARASRIARLNSLSHGVYDALRAQALVRLGKPRPALQAYRVALQDGALSRKTREEIERNMQALRRGIAAQASGGEVLP